MPGFNLSSWREDYKQREIKPQDMGHIIKPGNRIYIGSACSEPILLTQHIVEEQWRYADCQMFHFFTLSNQKFFNEEYPANIRHNSISIIGCPTIREAINKGGADFTPISVSDVPNMLISQKIVVDIALIQVTPPEKHGFCSLGTNVDINKTIVDTAKIVIAHINPRMPRTMGDSFINIDTDIDFFVYRDHPMLEFTLPEPTETHDLVAKNVAKLVENNSTLNLGLGKINCALPKYLKDKKDLALYGELFSPGIIDLIEGGIINCSKNHYSHCMTSFIIGGQEIFDFIHDNPFIEFHTTEFITDILNIAKNHKLCSIYSAVSVDLLGQVSNHLGTELYSGIGGEADLINGSAKSPRGKAIIALPSKTRDGKSRIVPALEPGPVSLCCYRVHYVVTEYGIAYIHGKSLRERALQIISIAAPEFRQELLERAKELKYVYMDQVLPTTEDGCVIIVPNIEWKYETKDKGIVNFRPVKSVDERLLQELYYRLNDEDRRYRFLAQRKTFPHEDIQTRMVCDYLNSLFIVGVVGSEDNPRIIAEGSFYVDENTNLAEVSITIDEEYRGQGLAKHIFNKLIELAKERGIAGFFGEIAADNYAMFHILNLLPYKIVFTERGSTFEFYFHFSDLKEQKE